MLKLSLLKYLFVCLKKINKNKIWQMGKIDIDTKSSALTDYVFNSKKCVLLKQEYIWSNQFEPFLNFLINFEDYNC